MCGGCIPLGGVNSRTNLAPLNYKYGYPFLRGFIYQFTCVLIGIGNTCFKVLKKLSDVIDLCGLGGLHHAPHHSGGVAQLVRALACHARGRGFESRHSRHSLAIYSADLCDLTIAYVLRHYNLSSWAVCDILLNFWASSAIIGLTLAGF